MQKIAKNVSKVLSGDKMDVTIEFLMKNDIQVHRITEIFLSNDWQGIRISNERKTLGRQNRSRLSRKGYSIPHVITTL